MPTLTIETGGPARVTVRGPDGAWHAPEDAVRDRTASDRPGVLGMDLDPTDGSAIEPGYTAHFLADGAAEVPVPRGACLVVVERGPEHRRVERVVDVGAGGARVACTPGRWADLAAEGWWSGDLHVHRPLADAAAVLRAEDLHVGAFVTRWNERARSERGTGQVGRPGAADVCGGGAAGGAAAPRDEAGGAPRAALTVDGDRHAVAPVTEDERGGGAVLLHGVDVPDLPGTGADDWWSPPARTLVDAARAAGAFVDAEKLTWWDAPVLVATGAPDAVGVLNNHFVPGGMLANEAWGRPRDRAAHPGPEGAARYQLGLWYRYLGLGLRLPASAGSASGVLPAPPGYDRVYVEAPGPLTVDGFYAGLRAGRSVVTNGPLLALDVGDVGPGASVPAGRHRVRAVARTAPGGAGTSAGGPAGSSARGSTVGPVPGPVRVELVVDGRVVAASDGPVLDAVLDLRGAGWVAARARQPDPRTIRLAHTSPVHVDGPGPDAVEHRAFFARWVADLTAAARAEPARFPTAARRDEVLDLYDRAARFYR
ncbi:CehA/McbA family metallohydrolase [Cellulomonas sp. Y8]|uniref:CehA/McbA family metallohydrolase n=1 Tax=Cellulomonas sp. Y8 TaxID=2591145 RepID=UPI003D74A741